MDDEIAVCTVSVNENVKQMRTCFAYSIQIYSDIYKYAVID